MAMSFTLNLTGKGFSKNEIDVLIAKTDCSNAGFSTERFRDLIKDAVNDYWNAVASADLSLNVQAVGDIDVSGMTHQEISGLRHGPREHHSRGLQRRRLLKRQHLRKRAKRLRWRGLQIGLSNKCEKR